ncbi:MAG: hypothetical protein WCR98_05635 [Saccharofermentanales bacterium]
MLYCPKCASPVKKDGFTTSGKQRYECVSCGFSTVSPAGLDHVDSVFDRKKVEAHVKGKADKYVITSAQNATPINEPFFASLLRYCEENSAKLFVIPYRYRNPTSMFVDKDHDWWDKRLLPYIADTRFNLTKNLQLMGDIKIQPTAARPLSGMDSMTGTECAIFGHPKVQLKSIATRAGEMAKIIATTGSITVPNYTNSKAGKKGQHHHSFSAMIVEKDGTSFHMRHITSCRDGSFIDLDREYTPTETRKAAPAKALVLGDLHHMFMDQMNDLAVFGFGGIVETLRPENVVLHDVIDSYSISHHHKSNPFINYVKHQSKSNSIRKEIEGVIDYLNARAKKAKLHVVSSNHHNHIMQWLSSTDWRNDPENAEFYLETALYMIRGSKMSASGASVPDPFKFWIEKRCPDVSIIDESNGLQIGDFELGFHGHNGPNGAKGSLSNLSKIGTKVIIGHSHTPGREDGSLSVGTSSRLDLEYAKGPSAWLHTHAVVYANGKPTLLTVLPSGKWKK